MILRCRHCAAETTNGLALCDLCQRLAHDCFDYLPVYFTNLARWKPGRAGSRQVPGSRVLWMGETRDPDRTGDRISDALAEATNALTTWARVLVEARPHFARPLTYADAVLTGDLSQEAADELADHPAKLAASLCASFNERLTSVATTDWCGEFVRDIAVHEARLRGLTETAAPGWYAGGCKRCGSGTYVVPGLTWVACLGCGMTTAARDHLETVLDEARGWVAPPKEIARIIVALVDSEPSVPRLYERIKKWGARGRIQQIRRIAREYEWSESEDRIVIVDQEVGPSRYRLGDVLDVLWTEGATRLDSGMRVGIG